MSSSVTLVFPLLLLTAIVIATATACADEEPPQSDPDVTGNGDDSEDYHPTDGLAGHGGLFRALNWTTEELRLISEWHATVQYSKVIRLVEVCRVWLVALNIFGIVHGLIVLPRAVHSSPTFLHESQALALAGYTIGFEFGYRVTVFNAWVSSQTSVQI